MKRTLVATGAVVALIGAQALSATSALASTSSHTSTSAARSRAAADRAEAAALSAVKANAVVRLAEGSASQVRQGGAVWAADSAFAGGRAVSVAHSGTSLTAHARVGARSYTVTVPKAAGYEVALVLPRTAKSAPVHLIADGYAVTTSAPVRQGDTMGATFTVTTKGRKLTFSPARGAALVLSGIAVAAVSPGALGSAPAASAPTTAVVVPAAPVAQAPVSTADANSVAAVAQPATFTPPTSLPISLPASLPITVPTTLPSSLPVTVPTTLPTSTPTTAPVTVPTTWLSGAWPGGSIDETAANAFAAYRGSALGIATVYPDWSSWSQLATSTWYLDVYKDFPGTLSIGVPLVAPNGGTLADVAAGDDDAYFTSFAKNLVAEGRSTSYLRLGWEFDGDWIPWSATDATDYVAAFRHVAKLLRTVVPLAPIVWNGTLGESHVGHDPFTDLYPGDDVVDVVGVDAYDTQWHHVTDDSSFYAYEHTTNGLDAWLDFAQAHGKLFAVPEWGLNDQNDDRDNATYIKDMHDFFAANAASLAYEAYFNEPQSYISSSLEGPDQNPRASAAYAALWSAQS